MAVDDSGVARVVRGLVSAPLTTAYAVTLLVTTLVLSQVSAQQAEQLLDASSTDVAHLTHDPGTVLLLSALWLPGAPWIVEVFVLLIVVAPLERQVGTARAAAVFLSGHVVATLLTEGSIGIAIVAGWLPGSVAHRLDVGASYGLMALVTAFAGGLPPVRGLVVFLTAGVLVTGVPTELDMTLWGHLLAVAVGACWWPVLSQRSWPQLGALTGSAGLRSPRADR